MSTAPSRKRRALLWVSAVLLASAGYWLFENASINRLRAEFIPWMKKLERWRDTVQAVQKAMGSRSPGALEPQGIGPVREWAWQGLERLDGVSYDVERPEHPKTGPETSGTVTFVVDGFRADGTRVERQARVRIESFPGRPSGRVLDLEILGERSEPHPRFRNATREAGLGAPRNDPRLQLVNRLIDGIWPGSGVAVLDYNLDGDEDLFVADGVRSILYENDGTGRFADVTERAGLAKSATEGIRATGLAAGDLDGDAFPEIVVTDAFGPTRVFRNRADGTFEDWTGVSGVVTEGPPRSASLADVDRDGDLDLLVCITGDYFKKMPDPPFDANDAGRNYLFLNDGKGRFIDASAAWGLSKLTRWSLTAIFSDFDDDGFPDLMITNDFGLKNLYRNVNGQRFEDVSDARKAADRGYGMSAAWGDLDGDGKLDLYTTGTYTQWGFIHYYPALPIGVSGRLFLPIALPWVLKMCAGNSVLLQRPDGTFEDVTAGSGAGKAGWAWSAITADLDNDGWLDLAVTNGMWGDGREHDREFEFWWETLAYWDDYVSGKTTFDQKRTAVHGLEKDRLFRNLGGTGKGRAVFEDRAFLDGFDPKTNGRALVAFDANGDGALDIYLRSVQAPEALYLGSRREGEHYLRLKFAGQKGKENAAGIGARVTAKLPDGRVLVRELSNASGFLASQSPVLHIGTGAATRVDSLTVRWPSGRVQELGKVEPLDRLLTVDSEKGILAAREGP